MSFSRNSCLHATPSVAPAQQPPGRRCIHATTSSVASTQQPQRGRWHHATGKREGRDCCTNATIGILCSNIVACGSFGYLAETLHIYMSIPSFSDQFSNKYPNQPRIRFNRSFQQVRRGRHFAASRTRTGIVFWVTQVLQNIRLSFRLNRGWLQQLVVGWLAHNFA
jgi:hypothetical protein